MLCTADIWGWKSSGQYKQSLAGEDDLDHLALLHRVAVLLPDQRTTLRVSAPLNELTLEKVSNYDSGNVTLSVKGRPVPIPENFPEILTLQPRFHIRKNAVSVQYFAIRAPNTSYTIRCEHIELHLRALGSHYVLLFSPPHIPLGELHPGPRVLL